jgi:hypothetical protein
MDFCFGLLIVWTAYVYFILRINAQIYIGEHILESDSQQGQVVQAITGLVIGLIAEHYGRAAASLCRRLIHILLTIASIRICHDHDDSRDDDAQHRIPPTGQSQGFELSVRSVQSH